MKPKSLWITLLVLTLLLAPLPAERQVWASTYTVINTNNSGAGSLRQAIADANSNPGPDTIQFNIPLTGNNCNLTTGVCTIQPTTVLPSLSGGGTTIDGYTQPGASPATETTPAILKIVIDGSSAGSWVDGLAINSAGNLVRGLVIHRFGGDGIEIRGVGAMGNTVSGSFIGTNVDGTADLGNTYQGVYIIDSAQDNTIGGDTPGERNLISGNNGYGIWLSGSGATGNVVSGNYIGTDAGGTAGLGNTYYGVRISNGAQNNTIGGDVAGERNLISDNNWGGVHISDIGTGGNSVSGNYIGTDASGTADLGNAQVGVYIQFGDHNTVGGDTPGERNIISGNDGTGVRISGSDAVGNTVSGNYIGTDASGTADLGNAGSGVYMVEGAQDTTIGGDTSGERNVISGNGANGVWISGSGTTGNVVSGNYIGIDANGTAHLGNAYDGVFVGDEAQNNTIGGDTAAEQNIISGNGWDGVEVYGASATGNTITRNSIFANDLGIDLVDGANGAIAIPVIVTKTVEPLSIVGTACPYCTVELFENSDADGEGETFVGDTLADASGDFTVTVSSLNKPYLTATATDAVSGTSEFSAVFMTSTLYIVNTVVDENDGSCSDGDCSLRDAIILANDTSGSDAIRFDIPISGLCTISVTSSLPPLTDNGTTIDGYSQPGALEATDTASATLKIVVDGKGAGSGANGLTINSARNVIRGLVIHRFSGNGIHIEGSGSTDNTISGNYIGTDASGTTNIDPFNGDDLGNRYGVYIGGGAHHNSVGGDTAGERNLISGNRSGGLRIFGAGTSGNTVSGNYIGTNASGTAQLEDPGRSRGSGIYIVDGAQENTIGGDTPAEGNLISSNDLNGIQISGSDTMSNTVSGNYIGTDAAGGVAELGNGISGVTIGNNAQNNTIGPGNLIADNSSDGVRVSGAEASGNVITQNSIFTNVVGINLITGANGGIATPVIVATTVGSLNIVGTACPECTVEVFENSDDNGEGETFIGNAVANTSGDFTVTVGSLGKPYLTATATDAVSGTSEFSAAFMAIALCVVNTVVDENDGSCSDGDCSLRDAMILANNNPGPDWIHFNIPIAGNCDPVTSVCTITPGSALPPLTDDGTTIDGYTQPGAVEATDTTPATLMIVLDGNAAGGGIDGFRIQSAGNTLKGLGIHRFSSAGISINGGGATGNTVSGNHIGTDASGTADLGNTGSGVYIVGGARDNTIGGDTPSERDVIAGNEGHGVWLSGSSTTGNVVAGNYIGTDASGTADLGNACHGVLVDNGAQGNTIGGDMAGERNLISGNNWSGVGVSGSGTAGNTVSGNYIGTAANGTADLGNTQSGVYIQLGDHNTIGGEASGERNVIAGNEGAGIQISGSGATGNIISGNYIGTDASGTAGLGNAGSGIYIFGGAQDNTVGGDTPSERNIITHNAGDGVVVDGTYTLGNTITRNSIFSNGMGIHLKNGGNGGIAPPTILAITPASLEVVGTACPNCTVELFENGSTDGEGETFIGAAIANTSGAFAVTISPPGKPHLTATVTDAINGTSEFSLVFTIPESHYIFLPIVMRAG